MTAVKSQSVAEHSFNVVCIALWLARHYPAKDVNLLEVMQHALQHDRFESITGDIASPAKRMGAVSENLPKAAVSQNTGALVKLADMLEALWFVRREKALGNTTLGAVEADLDAAIRQLLYENAWVSSWLKDDGMPVSMVLYMKFMQAVDFNVHPGMESIHEV